MGERIPLSYSCDLDLFLIALGKQHCFSEKHLRTLPVLDKVDQIHFSLFLLLGVAENLGY